MTSEKEACCRALAALEAERVALVAELEEWPEGRLRYRPVATAWCAVEVLDHVVRVEALTIGDVREGMKHPQALGEEDRPKPAQLERLLRSNRRFKVPAGQGGIYPEPQTTLAEVMERWAAARAELRAIVEGLAPEEARGGVFDHPFAGWMTVGEVVGHFSDHLYHHEFQLERLRVGSANGDEE